MKDYQKVLCKKRKNFALQADILLVGAGVAYGVLTSMALASQMKIPNKTLSASIGGLGGGLVAYEISRPLVDKWAECQMNGFEYKERLKLYPKIYQTIQDNLQAANLPSQINQAELTNDLNNLELSQVYQLDYLLVSASYTDFENREECEKKTIGELLSAMRQNAPYILSLLFKGYIY